MEETTEKTSGIINHNTNCQVFNGPISGCVFAMPGSTVTQNPLQQVAADGKTTECHEEARAQDDRLLIPIPDGMAEEIVRAPSATIRGADNTFVIRTIQHAGMACKEPWHFACLMAVCDDHGLLIDRTGITAFVRTMVAWGIVKLSVEKDVVKTLANSMTHTMSRLPLRYRQWDSTLQQYRDKCESLAADFDQSIPYRYQ